MRVVVVVVVLYFNCYSLKDRNFRGSENGLFANNEIARDHASPFCATFLGHFSAHHLSF